MKERSDSLLSTGKSVIGHTVNIEKSLRRVVVNGCPPGKSQRREIHRILRPNGTLIFIEHVATVNNLKRYRWQRRLEFLWKRFADGCHITRCTEDAILKQDLR
jgi:hypothetical protein